MKIYRNFVDSNFMPSIIQISENFYVIRFSLMKLLPAKYILEKAENDGSLKEGMTIIETSSGTFGLGLAQVCALKGYKLIIVGDPAIDDNLKRRMENLGAKVKIVVPKEGGKSIQKARLEKMNELRIDNPHHFWPSQYDNPNNPDSYYQVAQMIKLELGKFDTLVGPVGSGGSMCGTVKNLRVFNPELKAVGVDTHGSILFGQSAGKRTLRGLGNSILPKNLDHTVFDQVHWVNATDAFQATLELHKKHALFMGPTSGASYKVANHIANTNPLKKVLAILPDEGYRYQETVYNNSWLKDNDFLIQDRNDSPIKVDWPNASKVEQWNYMNWNRRDLNQIFSLPNFIRA